MAVRNILILAAAALSLVAFGCPNAPSQEDAGGADVAARDTGSMWQFDDVSQDSGDGAAADVVDAVDASDADPDAVIADSIAALVKSAAEFYVVDDHYAVEFSAGERAIGDTPAKAFPVLLDLSNPPYVTLSDYLVEEGSVQGAVVDGRIVMAQTPAAAADEPVELSVKSYEVVAGKFERVDELDLTSVTNNCELLDVAAGAGSLVVVCFETLIEVRVGAEGALQLGAHIDRKEQAQQIYGTSRFDRPERHTLTEDGFLLEASEDLVVWRLEADADQDALAASLELPDWSTGMWTYDPVHEMVYFAGNDAFNADYASDAYAVDVTDRLAPVVAGQWTQADDFGYSATRPNAATIWDGRLYVLFEGGEEVNPNIWAFDIQTEPGELRPIKNVSNAFIRREIGRPIARMDGLVAHNGRLYLGFSTHESGSLYPQVWIGSLPVSLFEADE